MRAAHDRALTDGGALFGRVDAMPAMGRAELELPAKPGRKRRILGSVLLPGESDGGTGGD